MTGDDVDSAICREPLEIDDVPAGISSGSTVLVASAGDPTPTAVGLQLLCRFGQPDDVAFVVTTAASADQTIETYERCCPEAGQSALRVVDTCSKRQSVSAVYDETPVVFTPSSGDLERLLLAISELFETHTRPAGRRYLVVRSLTPILESSSTARVCEVLERLTGLRSETGLSLLGLDYTAHGEETMAALAKRVDGVLWVTCTSGDRLELEYQPSRGRHQSVMTGGKSYD